MAVAVGVGAAARRLVLAAEHAGAAERRDRAGGQERRREREQQSDSPAPRPAGRAGGRSAAPPRRRKARDGGGRGAGVSGARRLLRAAPVATLPAGRAPPRPGAPPRRRARVAGRRVALAPASFAIAVPITTSSPAGMPGASGLAAGAGSLRCAYIFASSESRGNGTRPVSEWKRTAPSAYTSARASACSPRICSGAAKSGVPTKCPVRVTPPLAAALLVSPKSVRYACSSSLARSGRSAA